MVSRDWAKQHIHECIVGSLCRFCPARKLGLCANKLMHWWELTGQIWIYDYAVPVCKKGRPNCGGPSEEGKRPAGDDGRSHSKASKPLRCCDTRHSGRHGTPSSCNTNRSDTTASLMSPPLAAFAKLIRHMPPRFPLPVFAWRML